MDRLEAGDVGQPGRSDQIAGRAAAGELGWVALLGLDETAIERAIVLGRALRLGFTLSAGNAAAFAGGALRRVEDTLVLAVPQVSITEVGDTVRRRLGDLGVALDCGVEVRSGVIE